MLVQELNKINKTDTEDDEVNNRENQFIKEIAKHVKKTKLA